MTGSLPDLGHVPEDRFIDWSAAELYFDHPVGGAASDFLLAVGRAWLRLDAPEHAVQVTAHLVFGSQAIADLDQAMIHGCSHLSISSGRRLHETLNARHEPTL